MHNSYKLPKSFLTSMKTCDSYEELLLGAIAIPSPDKYEGINKPYAFPEFIYNYSQLCDIVFERPITEENDYSLLNDEIGIKINLMEKECKVDLIDDTKDEISWKSYENGSNRVSNKVNRNDSRTTLMIRNIPNKISSNRLKKILDNLIFGKYDFLYLRLDYTNGCNTGYAFINLISPDEVFEFYKIFQGYKWSDYTYSNKIVDLVYANIQGVQALFEKFRDSAVMMKSEEYRPKLFYTSGGDKGNPIANFDYQELIKQTNIKK